MRLVSASAFFDLGVSMEKLETLLDRMVQREREEREAAGIAEYESWHLRLLPQLRDSSEDK